VTNENEAEWRDTTADGNAATTIGELNSTGCVPIDEATVVVKEECFEVDDALSLPAQGKPLDSDLDDMEESSTIALEEMEKAAALAKDSYESELNKPIDEPPTITDNSKSKEPATRSPAIGWGVAYSTVEELNGEDDKVKTEEAVPTQPYEGIHSSPKTMGSNEIEQGEHDKFDRLTADNKYELGYPLNDTANSARQIETMMSQILEVEADTMIDEEEEEPHHAALEQGAAADQLCRSPGARSCAGFLAIQLQFCGSCSRVGFGRS
jgi:hypothetical protein